MGLPTDRESSDRFAIVVQITFATLLPDAKVSAGAQMLPHTTASAASGFCLPITPSSLLQGERFLGDHC